MTIDLSWALYLQLFYIYRGILIWNEWSCPLYTIHNFTLQPRKSYFIPHYIRYGLQNL